MSLRPTLTARLTLLYTGVSVVVLCGLGALVMHATQLHFVELDRDYLQDKAAVVQRVVLNSESQAQMAARLDELLQNHSGLSVRIEHAGLPLYTYNPIDFPDALRRVQAGPATSDWSVDGMEMRGTNIGMKTPPFLTPADPATESPVLLMLATDTHHHSHFLADLRRSLVWYLASVALLSGLLGWWAARRGLAPLRDMRERAQRVTAHQLDARMAVESVPEEMAELAQGLNAMLARLQNDFARLTEFSSDLAHELRTPISNLLTQTQVSLAQPRDASAYRDILASNAEEFQRLARMVSDMLLLAKTAHGLDLPHREPIDLRDEVQALFEFYDAVADDKHIALKLQGDAKVVGDRLMVRRAISNLLSNALRHSPPYATVSVRLSLAPGESCLCTENTGAAIDPVHLPRLFDRFYRIDKTRAPSDFEGSGLGLSITQAIMLAHGGNVTAHSDTRCTRFCLRFPAL